MVSLEFAVAQDASAIGDNEKGVALSERRRDAERRLASSGFESPGLPDAQLIAAVKRRLTLSGRPELRKVRVSVDPGGIRLQGRVSSYYLKQLAQASALAVEGVASVHNELVVH